MNTSVECFDLYKARDSCYNVEYLLRWVCSQFLVIHYRMYCYINKYKTFYSLL